MQNRYTGDIGDFGKKQLEVIIVICKFDRLDEYFTVRRQD